ncbi:MAG: O-antigen ligase family protein, partial [Mycobacteriales bacterium]
RSMVRSTSLIMVRSTRLITVRSTRLIGDLGRPTRRQTDAVGLLLLVLSLSWSELSAAHRPGSHPSNQTALLLGGVACLLAGRMLASLSLLVTPVVIGVLAGSAVLLGHDALQSDPLAGPLGYGNADGALAAQSCAALCLAAVTARVRAVRAGLLAAAGGMLAVTALTGSKSATALAALCITVTVTALLRPLSARNGRRLAAAAAALLGLAVTVTVVLGATYDGTDDSSTEARAVEATLTSRRPAFWHEALEQARQHPLLGVGPDLFQRVSPMALADPLDDRWAHSGYLQQAAETGVPGGVLAVALGMWGFVMLSRSPRSGSVIAVGAAGLASLTIQAAQDYTLHFAAVPLVAAALLGVATAVAPSRRLLPPRPGRPAWSHALQT